MNDEAAVSSRQPPYQSENGTYVCLEITNKWVVSGSANVNSLELQHLQAAIKIGTNGKLQVLAQQEEKRRARVLARAVQVTAAPITCSPLHGSESRKLDRSQSSKLTRDESFLLSLVLRRNHN